jgi:hypothetical protein
MEILHTITHGVVTQDTHIVNKHIYKGESMKAYIGGRLICSRCDSNLGRGEHGLSCSNKKCENSKKSFEMPEMDLKEINIKKGVKSWH